MSVLHNTRIPHFHPVELSLIEAKRFAPDIGHFSDGSIEALKNYLKLCDDRIAQMVNESISAKIVHRVRSEMIDQLIRYLLRNESKVYSNWSDVLVVAATGGYGRQEMSLMSDIDILVLYQSGYQDLATDLMQRILYVLWDLKFDVGHAIRDLQECRKQMVEDHTIMTAMLDVRKIEGSQVQFDQLIQLCQKNLNNQSFCRNFIQQKIIERQERLKKYGGSVYLLEPQIKEGEGGLRDLQLIRWLAKAGGFADGFSGLLQAGLLEQLEYEALNQGLDYLLHLRNKLHIMAKRKGDQMNFQVQRALAKDLGYVDDSTSLAVEKFMQNYYAVAESIRFQLKNLIQRLTSPVETGRFGFLKRNRGKVLDSHFVVLNQKIAAVEKDIFVKDPVQFMRAFEHVQNLGLGLHYSTRELITKSLDLVNDEFRMNAEVQKSFKSIMSNYRNLGKTLVAMHEVHFFDLLLPEFFEVRNRMQHDAYHVYTVDTHSIFAVQELTRLETDAVYQENFPMFYQVLKDVKRRDLLSISVLYHDVGKGQGGSHSVIGARMAKSAMQRLGYSEQDCEVVEFQVLSHLLMPHLSQRRDLEDLHMVSEFAKAMGSIERLNILFVLTWADIRAVSSEAWTDWKGRLLQSLYEKTKSIMESERSSEDYIRERVKDVRIEILRRMENKVDPDKLQRFLSSISPRYVVAHSDQEIYEHFHLLTGHDDSHFLFVEKEIARDSVSEILIYTLENPRVIPLVTGVMLSLDINILSMENFLLSDGHVFIKMTVQSSRGLSLREAGLVNSLRSNLHDVFVGLKNVDELIAKRKKPDFLLRKPVQRLESSVKVDNDVSAYYTVIDVFAHDRLGLLYDIVTCLVENGCYVDVCKISTKVEQVVDSFYVKDIFGHKITSKDKLTDIKKSLLTVVNEQDQNETVGSASRGD